MSAHVDDDSLGRLIEGVVGFSDGDIGRGRAGGYMVIAAAGNNGNDTPVYPAAYEDTIAVTALTKEF